jgi:thiol-disulfide isomerase/thioredoxin
MRYWFLIAFGLFLAMPVRAGETVSLDDGLKAHVVALDGISGPAVTGDRLAGKVVVVGFFASWCPPCLAEFAHFNELRTAYDTDDVTILAINIFENWSTFKNDGSRLDRFLQRTKPAFSVVVSDEATEDIFGGISRIPTTFVFGRDGRPVLHFIHEEGATKANPDMAELRAAVESAL